jgi:hypothetical protein
VDSTVRRRERDAYQGGPDDVARLVLARVRAGHVPYEHIAYAAHLGDPVARLLDERPRIFIECPTCRHRREERIRRNRDPNPQPTPLAETPKQCIRCNGTDRLLLDRGLILFVREVTGVSHRLLVSWAADCAQHQQETLSPKNPDAFLGRYRLPGQPTLNPELSDLIIPACRRWVATGEVSPLLYQRASINSGIYANLSVIESLATAVAASGMEGQDRHVRVRLANVASDAYHAAGGTRAERTWQEERLTQYLLGSV